MTLEIRPETAMKSLQIKINGWHKLNHRRFICRLFWYIRLLKTKSTRIEAKRKTQQNLLTKTQALPEKQRTAFWKQ